MKVYVHATAMSECHMLSLDAFTTVVNMAQFYHDSNAHGCTTGTWESCPCERADHVRKVSAILGKLQEEL
jgi:hypothetical protein